MGKKLTSLLAALSVAVVAGCVVTPTQPAYVYREPPPPRNEYPGYPPMSGYVWISGYWVWGGHGYDWFPGRWEAPRPGYRWVAPRWERTGERWYQHEGRWEHDSAPRQAMPPPVAPRYEPQRVEPVPRRDVEPDRFAPQRYEQREAPRPQSVQPPARPAEPQPRMERREPPAQPQQQFQAPRKEESRSQDRKDDNRGKGKPDSRRDPREER